MVRVIEINQLYSHVDDDDDDDNDDDEPSFNISFDIVFNSCCTDLSLIIIFINSIAASMLYYIMLCYVMLCYVM